VNIKIEKFEGPLSLLLKLIEQEELDITKISLASIADEYVELVKSSKVIDPEEIADFLVIAARLLYLKSKALLPYLYVEEDEEDANELEQQLRLYKEFLDATKVVEKMLGSKKFMYVREFNRKVILNKIKSFSPPKNLKQEDLKNVFEEFLTRMKPPEKLKEQVMERKISLEEKILSIQKILLNKIRVSFTKIMNEAESKSEIIVSFLAMLELMRQREVMLTQNEMFGEIIIEKC